MLYTPRTVIFATVMKKTLLLFVLPALAACAGGGSSTTGEGNITVSGTLANGNEQMVYLEQASDANNIKLIGSQALDGDEFSFAFNGTTPAYYRLRINDNNFINLILEAGDNAVITADAANLYLSYDVTGSEETERLRTLNKYLDGRKVVSDSLYMALNQHRTNQDYQSYVKTQQLQYNASTETMAWVRQFIDAKPASLSSLSSLQQLAPETDLAYFDKVINGLAALNLDIPYYNMLKQKLEQWSALAIGAEAPELMATNTNGEPFSLSSLRGKVVLVDFWASWCKPCRAENPNVVNTYNKYKDKGFTVMSVSLDGMPNQQNPKNDWLGAIKQDGLIWENHISELRGWQSSFLPAFGIQSIPFTILIDAEGKILAKNLRGPNLEQKLAEIFGG